MWQMSASEFKAKCLAILDRVAATGEPLTVLKRGKPVAVVVPPVRDTGKYPQDSLVGSVEICGDVVGPVVEAEAWEAEGYAGP